jgi:hypothetical protein
LSREDRGDEGTTIVQNQGARRHSRHCGLWEKPPAYMATARYHYADLLLVCQSSLSIMSERNSSRSIMRQKSNFVFIQISSQVSTKRSNRRVLRRLGRASRPQNNIFLLQHRIDLGFVGGDGVTSAGRSNASLLRRGADWIFCSAPSSSSNQLPTGLATVAARRRLGDLQPESRPKYERSSVAR